MMNVTHCRNCERLFVVTESDNFVTRCPVCNPSGAAHTFQVVSITVNVDP